MSDKIDFKSKNFLNALLYILTGLLLCIFRAQVLNVLLTVIGALFIAYGVIFLLRDEWTGGAVSLVIGIVLILGGWLFVEIVLIIFGILLTLKGVSDLVTAIRFRMPLAIIFACLTLAIGILLVVSYWAMLDWFFILLGVIFIVNGILALLQPKQM